MADSKISDLTELTTLASTDELVIVDKSDTSMAASGTNKRVPFAMIGGTAQRTMLLASASQVIHDQAAATLALVHGGYAVVNPSFSSAGAATTGALPILRYTAADHDRAGLTTQLLIRAQVAVNATAGGITFTFGLYPITVAGGADTLTFTLGTVVTGTTIAVASTASTIVNAGSTAQDMTGVSGTYCLGAVSSGTLANNSSVQLSAQLWRLYAYP